ncbi:MAG: DUF2306 domain-containing protein [Acidobacteria bacterium]|nr:DUF2306 domain-containing protein [Acidobacteriota bacterium]
MSVAFSSAALRTAAGFWAVVAVTGQLIFAFYVALFYGRGAASGDLAAWNKTMPHGYVAGDGLGNFAVGLHLALAVSIILAGALQLVPPLRERYPAVHRWTGRAYMGVAMLISLDGLFMVWTRGTVGGLTQHLGISLNAVLIMVCAVMALYYARARRFAEHRRWALRLFLVSSGVWFFRVGLMLWLAIHRAPVGFDPKTFEGPFLTFLGFAQYLLPPAVLELYLLAERGRPVARLAMAGGLVVLTLATGAGIGAATMGLWLPRLAS